MLVVGLTGGIGSGKSTVASMLADRGAVVCDADRIAREVVDVGTDGHREVVDAFGDGVLAPDGSLDRQALADVVFEDPEKRKTLESIVWPRVGQRITDEVERRQGTNDVVVLDVPLLLEAEGSVGMTDVVVVVAASEDVQLARLEARGMDAADATARMDAQTPLSEKIARADHVIWNDGTLDELSEKVDGLWKSLSERAEAPA